MSRRLATTAAALAAGVLALAGCGDDKGGDTGQPKSSASAKGTMILATTTSTQDSGLLDVLVPAFEGTGDCKVKTVAVGSGDALKLGERGDADVLLVHSPDAEKEFMSGGHGSSRLAVMHNDFVLVGPPGDPAGIAGTGSAPEAMKRIANKRAPFASRADESGTNTKELSLWEDAGVEPKGSWYIETGQGMGETLTIASQKQAYTLSDRGTFLATKNLDSKLLLEKRDGLLNPYHVIVVRHEGTNAGCAKSFSGWITSAGTQRTISRFGVAKYGERLFTPDAKG
jgi:tungstate transport system substrate-binding protein